MDFSYLIRHVFAGTNEAVIFTDKSGAILEINDAFVRLYQYPRSEIIGVNPRILKSGLTPAERYEEMWRCLLDPKIGYYKGEFTNKKKDCTIVPVLLYSTAIRDNLQEVVNFMGIALDLTELKQLEKERLEQQSRLAEIGAAASAIIHDLSSPLTSVIGYSELCLDSLLDRKTKKMLLEIKNQAERLSAMIHEITELATGRPELQVEKVSLRPFIQAFIKDIKKRPYLIGITLSSKISFDGAIQIDRGKIYRVLENLVKNAAEALEKQTSKSKTIEISVEKENNQTRIGIHDNGQGVPVELVGRLFNTHVTFGKIGKGSGIGLSSAKKIIELHGGQISYERTNNTSSFIISLPMK